MGYIIDIYYLGQTTMISDVFVYKYVVRVNYGNYFITIYYVFARSDCSGKAAQPPDENC